LSLAFCLLLFAFCSQPSALSLKQKEQTASAPFERKESGPPEAVEEAARGFGRCATAEAAVTGRVGYLISPAGPP
jgi:hypothetical protein